MDKKPIDLNVPMSDPSLQLTEVPAEKPKEEPKAEPKVVEEKGEAEVPDEKPRVTYSRFKNVHQRAIDAEQEARVLRAQLEQLESEPRERFEVPRDGSLPEWWTKLYGESDASKEAYQIQSKRELQLLEEAEDRAVRKLEEKQFSEKAAEEENLKTIDDELENLTAFVGRDLTEKEQDAVLDIVDEFTPKGDDGKYLGQILPFDKAWEIYELKNEAAKAPSRSSRDQVASLTSSGTQGEPSSEKAEEDKAFNPSWSALGEALRKRL